MASLVIPSYPIVINMPQGSSSLPMVEIDRDSVKKDHKPIRLRAGSARRNAADCSFGNFTGQLDFTAWEFFHAAKKTELASSFSNAFADRRAFAFALEHENTFIWDTHNLRKTDSSVFALADFASAGLSGRIGEAIAYLTMIKWGYVFWDRCATVWERAASGANIAHQYQLQVAQYLSSEVASGRPQSEPDFIFEKNSGEVALMEAKGSFVNPIKDDPSVKTDLKQALKQLDAWSKVVAPVPQKSYGIGAYIREEHDNNGDPSLIAYVDPSGQEKQDIRLVKFPPDLVRRCNYGLWLMGMGLVSSGLALRDGLEKRRESISLPIFEVNGKRFACTIAGWESSSSHLVQCMPFIQPLNWIQRINSQPIRTFVIGIEENVLHLISEALYQPTVPVLMDVYNRDANSTKEMKQESSWSVMPDGSFLGLLDRDIFDHENWETFKL